MTTERAVKLGILGCGNVGAALVELLADQHDTVMARTGINLAVTSVAVRSPGRDRGIDFADGVITADAAGLVSSPDVDVVVELIGGIEPARKLILAALAAGKPVVTGNKELISNHGAELFAAAEAAGVDLLFEAAVAGGIPVMRALHQSLVGESITRVMGIVNGTTNFILTQMSDHGASYGAALAEAQSLGYAEQDPTADVEGFDAAAKAAIIATIAFGQDVVAGDVYHEGISGVTVDDINFAAKMGYVVKLLAIAELQAETQRVAVRVHPTMVPVAHPLASVGDSFNAVFVEGEAVGDLMLYGRGAGGRPTASAVLGDIIDAATNLRQGAGRGFGSLAPAEMVLIDDLVSEYYLNLEVVDQPGVLAEVAGVFGGHGVSIRSMEQEGLGQEARLVFITHEAADRDLQATLHDLGELEAVRQVSSVLRLISS